MKTESIINQIAGAGEWLPLTCVRRAFDCAAALTPLLMDKVQQEVSAPGRHSVRDQRLAAFGVFFLGQLGQARLFEWLIQMFEGRDPWQKDEWIFSSRLFFYGHRLLANCSPRSARGPVPVALDLNLKPLTRATAIGAIGLQAAYGITTRKQAVHDLRRLFNIFKNENHEGVLNTWALTACKIHSGQFEKELLWCLAANRISEDLRPLVNVSLQHEPDRNFASILPLESPVDLMDNVFPRILRDGEMGFDPNAIPNLEDFTAAGAYQSGN